MATEKSEKKYKGSLGRVVVIGGNGFLGHHIINQLLESWTVSAVSSVDLRCDRNRNPDAGYYECDITDTPRLTSVFEDLKPDVVIHTASPPAATEATIANEIFKKVNIDGTQSVVEACQQTGVKVLVYTSSASIVSDYTKQLYNADERWPVLRGEDQPEYYSETKAAAEEIVLKANRADPHKLLTCSIRPAGIFGERDIQNVAGFLKVLRTGRDNVQLGNNTNIFDFTYVANVAHAHLLAARLLVATASTYDRVPLDHERVDGEPFFVTNDSPCYFWDFARSIWRAAGSERGKAGVWKIPGDLAGILGALSEIFGSIIGIKPSFTKLSANLSCANRYYNITKAKTVLGYEPIFTLQEGVNRAVASFLEDKTPAVVKAA
jgi:sterol-4alpha-carboxylate 3-dehydrogenase (decarboxylating)